MTESDTMGPIADGIVQLDRILVELGGERILDGTSLVLKEGVLSALVGPSGCGKTTLLGVIADLFAPQGGTVLRNFDGIGVVFQDHRLLPWRTALQNVSLGAMARLPSGQARRHLAQTLLDECGLLQGDHGKYPHELSGGMRARVAIARALAAEPSLLLLDEPFNGLDVSRRASMQRLLRRLIDTRGVTALFVTHDLEEALRIADELLLMAPKGGRLVHKYRLTQPFEARTADAVHAELARLKAHPRFATVFANE